MGKRAKREADRIWRDRKRHLRMPLSFTKYSMSEDRLFLVTGVFNLKEEEILLYRVRDITLKRSFGQRLLGEGTVCIKSSDLSVPHLDLVNILHPYEVKDMISEKVEEAKERRRMKATELIDAPEADIDGDGVPDALEDDEDLED